MRKAWARLALTTLPNCPGPNGNLRFNIRTGDRINKVRRQHTMPQFLFTVDDVFDVAGRYVIPTPGVPVSVRCIRNGLPIELRRPDGSVLQTEVASVPMLDPYD